MRVRAHAKRSRLYHSKAIAERVERGITHRLGARASLRSDDAAGPGGGDLQRQGARVAKAGERSREPTLIQVRMVRDRCTISVDTTGTLLHKRGWRQQTAKAPLREDIARALIVLSGWRPGMAVFDPVAGAGTLVIEAATIAAGRAPGLGRSFTCVERGSLAPGRVAELRAQFGGLEQAGHAGAGGRASMVGGDRDAGAVEAARANAARAGVAERVEFHARALGARELPALELGSVPGVALLANPPWGRRVGDPQRLRNLYASLGKLAQRLPRPTRIGLVTSDDALARATKLGLEHQLTTDHGGVKVGLWTGLLQ